MGQKIEVEPAASSMDANLWNQVVNLANLAYSRVPMTKIEFKRQGLTVPALYKYTLQAVDGRKWEQSILFDQPSDPGMSFDVPGYWRELAEFAEFRALRAGLIRMVNDHAMQSFKSDWS